MLTTYNGESYIKQQIISIINQSYSNWILIIRDDGSTDNTRSILFEFEKNEPRIKVLKDKLGNLKQCKSFDLLMKKCSGEKGYFMFADQDDFWHSNKIELSLNKIQQMEKKTNKNEPILVYTNYSVTDSNLNKSKLAFINNLDYSSSNIRSRLLVQNWILGCTMILNRPLLKLAINIPIQAENHDYWLAILSAFTGQIGYINECTMKHRIHSTNVTTNIKTTRFSSRLYRLYQRFKKNNDFFAQKSFLIGKLKERISSKIDIEGYNIMTNFLIIINTRGFKAIKNAYKSGFYSVNRLQTLLFFTQLLFKH